MKKAIFIFIIAIFVTGCYNYKKKVIIDYIQNKATIGNMQIDLQPKILKLKKLATITVKDSLPICEDSLSFYEEKFGSKDPSDMIQKIDTCLNKFNKLYESTHDEFYSEKIEEFKFYKEKAKEFKLLIERVDRYKKMDPNYILANVVACTYTIKNPIMGLVTINTKYYFSPDNRKILSESD